MVSKKNIKDELISICIEKLKTPFKFYHLKEIIRMLKSKALLGKGKLTLLRKRVRMNDIRVLRDMGFKVRQKDITFCRLFITKKIYIITINYLKL